MRHRKNKKTLDRKKEARTALIKNLANNFILHDKLKTTEAKAKVVRPYVEKLITHAKQPNLSNIRYIRNHLLTLDAVFKLTKVLGPRFKERHGGYTRVIKFKERSGDGSKMAQLELV